MNSHLKSLALAVVASSCMVACGAGPAQVADAQPTETSMTVDAADSQAAEPRRFDAMLSEFPYPYDVKTHTFETQNQSLVMAYMDVQPETANGKTVLLLHGKNFSGAYWATTITPLVEAGYRVVVPDQVGFGKSSKPERYQYTFQSLATNTKGLLDAIGVEKVAVVGHSMGGMVATRFTLMFPEATTGLVLVNPIGLEDWKLKVPYVDIDTWYANELTKTPEKVKAYMTKAYFDGTWKDAYQPLVELQAGWTQDPDYPTIAWASALTYDMIFTQPVVYEFPNVEAPTLLIIGDRDRTALGRNMVAPEVAATMGLYGELGRKTADAIPGAELVLLEGIGHIPQYESFDAYYQALSDFLAR